MVENWHLFHLIANPLVRRRLIMTNWPFLCVCRPQKIGRTTHKSAMLVVKLVVVTRLVHHADHQTDQEKYLMSSSSNSPWLRRYVHMSLYEVHG